MFAWGRGSAAATQVYALEVIRWASPPCILTSSECLWATAAADDDDDDDNDDDDDDDDEHFVLLCLDL